MIIIIIIIIIQDWIRFGGEVGPLVIVYEIDIRRKHQIVYAQTKTCSEECDTEFSEILRDKDIF